MRYSLRLVSEQLPPELKRKKWRGIFKHGKNLMLKKHDVRGIVKSISHRSK